MITGKIHETQMKGLTSTLSDYDCGDGELLVCHNLLNDGAGLRPVAEPETVDGIESGYELVFCHHVAQGKMYVTEKDGRLWWWNDGKAAEIDGSEGVWQEGSQITSVGNILCMTDGGTTRYWLWNGETEGYVYLGDKLPELKMEFGLKLSMEKETYDESNIYLYSVTLPLMSDTVDETQQTIYGTTDKNDVEDTEEADEVISTFETVFGIVNKLVAKAKESNRFCFPFFVRYAYELYDGSLAMHSVPILMLPSTTINPIICCHTQYEPSGSENHGAVIHFQGMKFYCWLYQAALNARVTAVPDLSNWKDLVQSVKIFVSDQIYPYDPDGHVMTLENRWKLNQNYRVGWGIKPQGGEAGSVYIDTSAFATKFYGQVGSGFAGAGEEGDSWREGWLYLPPVEEEAVKNKIEEAYNFYLFKEYSVDELSEMTEGEFFEVKPLNDTLTNIETREQMKDDYHTHDIIAAKVLNTYNSRLNKANCRMKPFTDVPGEWLSCYTSQESEDSDKAYTYWADIYIKNNGVTLKVETTEVKRGLMTGYFFYPNPDAYLMILHERDESIQKTFHTRLTLKKHPYLYGAYWYGGFDYEWVMTDVFKEEAVSDGETAFCYPNYIYTSEVDNPFIFPSEGLNAVGSGEITALKTATKAMSQGTAFGANPLYVFCTDGVWALELSDTGVFTAKQPVSRETLLGDSALSATQIDNSVLFLSERGLMELVGGETRLLSGALQGMERSLPPYWPSGLPHEEDITEKFGVSGLLPSFSFRSYISGARIAFDYVSYRVTVFRPYSDDDAMSRTAYIYDIGSKMWGTAENRLTSVVEDGGVTYVNMSIDGVTHVGEYVRSGSTLSGGGRGLYVSRPLKLDAPDTLNTVRTLVERGVWSGVKYLAAWGSRDMRHWTLIGAVEGCKMPRMSGTPYKYFIVGGWTEMAFSDAVSRLTADVAAKYGDKIR